MVRVPHRPPHRASDRVRLLRHDMAFRPALTRLRGAWQEIVQVSSPVDGFYLVSELRVPRRRASYQGSNELLAAFEEARRQIADTPQMSIRYAGPGQWSVFARPEPWQRLQGRGRHSHHDPSTACSSRPRSGRPSASSRCGLRPCVSTNGVSSPRGCSRRE
jgi:hypothetical protein